IFASNERRRLKELRGIAETERDQIRRESETRQKELLIEAREEAHRLRDEIDEENKERRSELQRLERKLAQKEETLEEKLGGLDRQWEMVRSREREAEKHYQEVLELKGQQKTELQRVAGMTADEARAQLMKDTEDETRMDAARLIHQI